MTVVTRPLRVLALWGPSWYFMARLPGARAGQFLC
jgi:hypothetical protein